MSVQFPSLEEEEDVIPPVALTEYTSTKSQVEFIQTRLIEGLHSMGYRDAKIVEDYTKRSFAFHVTSDAFGKTGAYIKVFEKEDEKAAAREEAMLQILPEWWGVRHIDTIPIRGLLGTQKALLTSFIPFVPWSRYTSSAENDAAVAVSIFTQLMWLHEHEILHDDIALRNVLLDPGMRKATIVDFEFVIEEGVCANSAPSDPLYQYVNEKTQIGSANAFIHDLIEDLQVEMEESGNMDLFKLAQELHAISST